MKNNFLKVDGIMITRKGCGNQLGSHKFIKKIRKKSYKKGEKIKNKDGPKGPNFVIKKAINCKIHNSKLLWQYNFVSTC